MGVVIGWLTVIIVIGVVGIIAGAIVAALLHRPLSKALDSVSVSGRFWLSTAVLAAPLLLAMSLVFIAFYPPVFDALGIWLGQCHCSGAEPHSCAMHFMESGPPALSGWWSAGALMVMVGLTVRWGRVGRSVAESHDWSKQLLKLAEFDEDIDGYVVDSERAFAMTTGIFRPRIVVSNQLRQKLTPEQFDAVLEHERGHRSRFEGMVFAVLNIAGGCHFPATRTLLLDAASVASEQLCDRRAARQIGDRLTVAEAILALKRSTPAMSTPTVTHRFSRKAVERRVEHLLDEEAEDVGRGLGVVCILTLLVVVVANSHQLHHLLEQAIATLR